MTYEYNKDKIKEELTIEQIYELVSELHGEPNYNNNHNCLICKTICHHYANELNDAGYKLYYYDNSHLFHCYSGCDEPSFDIFELVRKVKTRELGKDYQLPQAIQYVAEYFGYAPKFEDNSFDIDNLKEDWKIFEKYERINEIKKEKQIVELKTYDDSILKNLPRPKIGPWLREGITQEVMDAANICFDPKNYAIVIPHYDIDNRLIGIRERTMVLDLESKGKYRPAYLNKVLYNHPLSFNLYNLNNSKENISKIKKAIVFEGEKSPLLYRSYFGAENDISVACCGSSFIQYQAKLLMDLGVEEIIIAFDKQFQEPNDDEFKKLVKNLKNIDKKYGNFVRISFIFDKDNLIGYKDSPIDCGKDIFLELFKKRVYIR